MQKKVLGKQDQVDRLEDSLMANRQGIPITVASQRAAYLFMCVYTEQDCNLDYITGCHSY